MTPSSSSRLLLAKLTRSTSSAWRMESGVGWNRVSRGLGLLRLVRHTPQSQAVGRSQASQYST
eukprot:221757-Pyramimonas_sp.AAC.1